MSDILLELEEIIKSRKNANSDKSYTKQLFDSGLPRIAQKVGEEGVEVVIAAMKQDKKELINESTDLIYHLLVLLVESNVDFKDIINQITLRQKK